ncbi:MAG: PilZ domain-containing protein [Terriglobales bacterium]
MTRPGEEHRVMKRFSRFVPVTMRILGDQPREIQGITKDVSETGIYLYTDVAVEAGVGVELSFAMPKEVTLIVDMNVRAKGHVLRVTRSVEKFGVAITLDTFEVL